MERVRREIDILSVLRHPHIIKVIDGEKCQTVLFFALLDKIIAFNNKVTTAAPCLLIGLVYKLDIITSNWN